MIKFAVTLAICAAAVAGMAQTVKNTPPGGEAVSLTAEEAKLARACQENLAKLDGATEQFALEYKLPIDTTVTMQNLLDPNGSGNIGQGYLKRKPVCPSGGTYTLNGAGREPECSIGVKKGHGLDALIKVKDAITTTAQ